MRLYNYPIARMGLKSNLLLETGQVNGNGFVLQGPKRPGGLAF